MQTIFLRLSIKYKLTGCRFQKAFEFNLQRAGKGDVEAQYHVYEAYWNGVGVEEDHEKANRWLKNAADGGHTISQALMGFHEMIFGDASTAVQYWEKPAPLVTLRR